MAGVSWEGSMDENFGMLVHSNRGLPTNMGSARVDDMTRAVVVVVVEEEEGKEESELELARDE
jgi:hypothetical protein